MRVINAGGYALGLGWLIALLVLILCIVFIATQRLDIVPGGLIAALALAMLLSPGRAVT